MHPFGGTPICPRCSKAVYAAEQIMGPGRKLYHKPCLACKSCGKRLDSFSLVEHNEEPYCKNCHVKLFGTRDLRHANLPHRDDLGLSLHSPPASPVRANTFQLGGPLRAASPPALPPRNNSSVNANGETRTNGNGYGNGAAPPLPARRHATGGGALERNASPGPHSSPAPGLLRPTRTLSPGRDREQRSRPASLLQATEQMQRVAEAVGAEEEAKDKEEKDREKDEGDWEPTPVPPMHAPAAAVTPTHVGRGAGGLPRTIPLFPNAAVSAGGTGTATGTHEREQEQTSSPAPPSSEPADRGRRTIPLPLAPSATGTRYGAALGGGSAAVPLSPTMTGRQWGGGTPRCGRCGQPVYFAEQVKAVGKTWHKACLRCAGCGHTLDSGKVVDREGEPFCARCYGKRFGPQGSGYALLGKPGG